LSNNSVCSIFGRAAIMMIRSVLLVLQNNEIYELLVSGLNNS